MIYTWNHHAQPQAVTTSATSSIRQVLLVDRTTACRLVPRRPRWPARHPGGPAGGRRWGPRRPAWPARFRAAGSRYGRPRHHAAHAGPASRAARASGWRAGCVRVRRPRRSSHRPQGAAALERGVASGRNWESRVSSMEAEMSDRTYRVTEIVGTSPDGFEPAIRGALERAGQTLRHLDWFEVTQIRGQVVDGQVAHFQVGLKVGFRLEDA